MKIGLHVIPIGLEGRTDELLDHARRMNGACHKFLDPLADRTLFRRLFDATPASEWVLRNHRRSEDKDAMKRDPFGTGKRHAEEWKAELYELGLTGSPAVLVEGINEEIPNSGPNADAIARYSISFLSRCSALGIRAIAPLFSVGWPPLDASGRADWRPYMELLRYIATNPQHGLGLHEYWPGSGPAEGWGYLAGRVQHCPIKGLPLYITECGTDNVLDNGKRGWRDWGLTAPQIAAQIIEYAQRLATLGFNVKAVHPFTTGGAREWESFYMQGEPNELLARHAESAPAPAPSPSPAPPPPTGGTLPAPELVNWPAWAGPIERAAAGAGTRYWRLVRAEMADDNADLHHIFWTAPRDPSAFAIIRNRGNGEMWREALDGTGEFALDFPMWRHTDGNTYDVWMEGFPSDKLTDLHLEGNRHVSFLLSWELATAPAPAPAPVPVPPPTPAPPPVPSDPAPKGGVLELVTAARWWDEEAIRRVEAGKADEARVILLEQVAPRLSRVEKLLKGEAL